MTTSANETQVAGTHYRSAVQHWDFAVAYFATGYLRGQITKYLCRWRKKGGVQDLEKAAHFLRKLIEVESRQRPQIVICDEFIAANGIPAEEAEIIRIVTLGGESLKTAEAKLAALIAAEPARDYVNQAKLQKDKSPEPPQESQEELIRFFIVNVDGDGLKYVQGSLFWTAPDNIENLLDFTHFNSIEEAAIFAKERLDSCDSLSVRGLRIIPQYITRAVKL